jgi:hypothetical protein
MSSVWRGLRATWLKPYLCAFIFDAGPIHRVPGRFPFALCFYLFAGRNHRVPGRIPFDCAFSFEVGRTYGALGRCFYLHWASFQSLAYVQCLGRFKICIAINTDSRYAYNVAYMMRS